MLPGDRVPQPADVWVLKHTRWPERSRREITKVDVAGDSIEFFNLSDPDRTFKSPLSAFVRAYKFDDTHLEVVA